MKKVLLLFLCLLATNAFAQTYGNNQLFSVIGGGASAFSGGSTDVIATGVETITANNGSPDFDILTYDNEVNIDFKFFTVAAFSKYVFDLNGQTTTVYDGSGEKTYSVSFNTSEVGTTDYTIWVSYFQDGYEYTAGVFEFTINRAEEPVIPATPTGLTATRTGDGNDFVLSWTNKANTEKIDIQYKPTSSSTWSKKSLGSAATSYTFSNLSLSSYDFRVRAGSSAGYSAYTSKYTVSSLSLNKPTDFELFRPYYYNMRWSDVNSSLLSGKIEIQQGGYYGYPDSYYTIATINDLHETHYILGPTLPNQKFRLKLTDNHGRVVYSNVEDRGVLKPVTDLHLHRPYYYNLDWTDPNSSLLSGKIEIQKGFYNGNLVAYSTIATLTDIHQSNYMLGPTKPQEGYRLKLTDQRGNVVYSNLNTEGFLQPVTDLELFTPYYYGVRWTDPNWSYLSGTIQVQKNGYYGDPNLFYTLSGGTIDLHDTYFQIGPNVDSDDAFRLKLTDEFGRVEYSNIVTLANPGGRFAEPMDNMPLKEEAVNQLGYMVYPVPADTELFIGQEVADGTAYNITDVSGRMVMQQQVLHDHKIDVSSLAEGVYMLRIEGHQPKRIVVQ